MLAPGLFSMMNLPPRRGSAAAAVIRAAVSTPAPAPTGTMTRIGRLGKSSWHELRASTGQRQRNSVLQAA